MPAPDTAEDKGAVCEGGMWHAPLAERHQSWQGRGMQFQGLGFRKSVGQMMASTSYLLMASTPAGAAQLCSLLRAKALPGQPKG